MSANVEETAEKELQLQPTQEQQPQQENVQPQTNVVGIETAEKNLEESESNQMLGACANVDCVGNSRNVIEADLLLLHNAGMPSTSQVNVNNDSCDNTSGDEGIGDMEPENTVTLIKETVKGDASDLLSLDMPIAPIDRSVLVEIPLTDIARDHIDDDHTETDTLSPLMTDNHVYVEHFEHVKNYSSNDNNAILVTNLDDDFDLYDEEDDEEDDELDDEDFADEEHDSVGTLIPQVPSHMKHSDTKDSISSLEDSDLSLSYDIDNKEQNKLKLENYLSSDADENAKDSGCDLKNMKGSSDDDQIQNSIPFDIPDDDFCEKIVEQVEFYFSNDSLLKDAFLLKHVRRNKEGFVSLKLISSFKRVRQLTKDWRVVGNAIKRKSKKIELNDIETKIRRLEPLPLYDETTPSRTVVATNFAFDKLTIEKVSDIFSKCGEIALVRILRNSGPIPSDVKQFINKHPELQRSECALIEFTESSAARKAQKMDNLLVYELVLPKKKTGKKANNMTKLIENFKYSTESEIERSRGGENMGGLSNRFKLKRNSSAHIFKSEPHVYQYPRKMSEPFGSYNPYAQHHNNPYPTQQYYEVPPRRMSNCSPIPQQQDNRKYSNCSDGYSSCSEIMSRRQSACSDISRRLSNCSDFHAPQSPPSRRPSTSCSEHNCPCSKRMSQYSNDSYRRMSNMSNGSVDFPRRFSNASSIYSDRKYSTASTSSQSDNMSRRVSFDANAFEQRKNSMTYERIYDPITRKLSSSSDYYVNGRKISTDSGYDRRMSINSQYDNEPPMTRSRNNSLICGHPPENAIVRNPIGPIEGTGFKGRTRKIGQAGVVTTQ
jgi:la-related protein 6